jgi:putative membrane protein
MPRAAWLTAILYSALVVSSGCGSTADSASQGAPGRGGAVLSVTPQDQRFVAEAVPAGLAEVELSRLAAERASRDDVRAFAQRMVDDHSQTNERLLAFARHYQIDAPTRPTGDHAQTKAALAQLEGVAFDRAYMQNQVAAHERQIALYQRQAERGKAAALQALAQTTAPTLKEHLQAAQEIARVLPVMR